MVSERKSEDLAAAISQFVATCELPALLESGESPIPLSPERFRVELSPKGLWLEAWDERRMWSRRILSAGQPQRKRLELEAFRFGKKPVKVTLLDAADTRSNTALEKTFRSAFAERFRLFLNRHFSSWHLREFRHEANLEKSQSPIYPSALYTRGTDRLLAFGAPPRDTSYHALTFALIALHAATAPGVVPRLVLYLPEAYARPVLHLARRLHAGRVRCEIWLYSEDGQETLLDPEDQGNLESCLAPRVSRLGGPAWWMELVQQESENTALDVIEEPDGSFSYRILGLEVARMLPCLGNSTPKILWGPKLRSTAEAASRADILRYWAQVKQRRRADPEDLLDPLYLAHPERWLESSVRRNIRDIDAQLQGEIYGQVIGSWGGERSTADLLALDHTGRIAVMELKASEDIHLPLQALDYWLRVRHHQLAGDFTGQGYWPGRTLSAAAPKLYLIAPALHFHPSTQAILSFFPPECDAEIVGLAANWRQRATVALRM